MTNTNKITNKSALEYVMSAYGEQLPADVVEKLNGMIAQLEKRSNAERKPSARQIENEKLKELILDSMEENRLYGIAEMIKEFDFFPVDITPQRVSSLMTSLLECGKVEKTIEKRKVFFSIVK